MTNTNTVEDMKALISELRARGFADASYEHPGFLFVTIDGIPWEIGDANMTWGGNVCDVVMPRPVPEGCCFDTGIHANHEISRAALADALVHAARESVPGSVAVYLRAQWRLDQSINEVAEAMFEAACATLAARFPEITTGDAAPDATESGLAAMKNFARHWVAGNLPA